MAQSYRALFENVPEIVYALAPDGRFTLLNPAFEKTTGWSVQEWLGKPFEELIHPQDRDMARREFQRALQGETRNFREMRVRAKSGEVLVMEVLGVRQVKDGQTIGVTGFAHDITQRKRVEQELRQATQEWQATFDATNDAIWILDPDQRVLRTNKTAESIFRRTGAEMVGRRCWEITHGTTQPIPECPLLRAKHSLHRETMEMQIGTGWFQVTVDPILDVQGAHVGTVHIVRDITERKGAEEALARQASQLTLLNEIGSQVAAFLDVAQVFDRAAHLVQERFGYHHVGLFTRSPTGDRVVMQARAGEFASLFPPDHSVALGQGMIGWVAQHGETLLANDVSAEPRYVNLYPDRLPTRSELTVPLRIGDETVGVLDVQSPRLHAFSHDDVTALETLADQIAVAIHNARLYRRAVQVAERLTVLHRASQEIALASRDQEQVCQAIHRAAAALLPAEAFVIVLRDEAAQQNEAVYLVDKGGRWPARRIPADQGLSGQVIARGQSLLIDDFSPDMVPNAVHFGEPEQVRAILAVPLRLGERVIGMISAQSYQPAAYTVEAQALLEMLAAHAAVALENARLFQETQQRLWNLSHLFEASTALSTSLDLETVLHTIARQTLAALGGDGCVISRWDREQDVLITLLDYSPDPDRRSPVAPGTIYPLARFPVLRQVLSTCRPLAVRANDPAADPAGLAWMRSRGGASVLLAPLVIGDQAVGLLEFMETQQERIFSPTEIHLCQTLANQSAAALEHARLYHEAQRRNRELTLLNRVIAATAAGENLEPVLNTVCRELALAFGVPRATAALFNREKTEAVVMAGYLAPGQPSWLGECIPVAGNPAAQHLLIHKTPLVSEEAQADLRQAALHDLLRRQGIVSLLLLPLLADDEVEGWLGIEATEPRTFSPEEIDLAQRVAAQVSGLLARVRLEEKRRRLEEQFLQAQKMEAVGRLAGGVAHDFNNLLTVIHLSTRILERKLRPEDPLWTYVQRIQDAGQRASGLTKQLLAFSRREVITPHVLNLNQVLNELDTMLRRLIGEDIELIMHLADDLWPVLCDPTQIEQVVINLVVNARDAMPNGGRLTIETANVVLDATYAIHHLEVKPGDYVLLAISDNGVGMNDEVKAHLFEPFFTTKEKGRGTGLGLATVFGIVKQNQGHIGVYSEVGLGTTFKIYLPRTAEKALIPTTHLSQMMTTRGSETLLLVEDETRLRELMRDILLSQGYQVLAARDGLEALQIAEAYLGPIHLLLTDVVLPRLNGKELADRLCTSRPNMQVLFTSGYTDNVIAHHGVLHEGVHFLAKPFELDTLARKVREVLDIARQQTIEGSASPPIS